MGKTVKNLLLWVLSIFCCNSAMGQDPQEWYTVIDGVMYSLNLKTNDQGLPYDCWADARIWGNAAPENINILAEVDIDQDGYTHHNLPVKSVKLEELDSYNVRTVFLPSTIESFGIYLPNLESVTIDNDNPIFKSVDGAVYSKNMSTLLLVPTKMNQLVIPEGVKVIGDGERGVFNPAVNINLIPECSIISIPETVTTISNYAFYKCSNLQSIVIPNSVETIGYNSFAFCTGLKEITLSQNLSSIDGSAFYHCEALMEINLPKNLSSIGQSAFSHCDNLKAINVDEDNLWYKSTDGVLFDKSMSELVCYPCGSSESYTVPYGVVRIGSSAFNSHKYLKNIVLPESLETIGSYAFGGCEKLEQITLPNSLKEIEDGGFAGCPFYRLTLPKNLKKIGKDALGHFVKLKSLAVEPPELGYMSSIRDNNKVIVPTGSVSAYKSADNWKKLNISSFAVSRRVITINPQYVFQNDVDNVDQNVKWSSSDESIAYVNESNLVVSRGKIGKCTLYLTSGEETDSCVVEIREAVEISNISRAAEKEPTSIIIDGVSADRSMLNVHLEPVGATTLLKWSSSDESIATIDCGLIDFKRDAPVTFSVESSSGEISEYLYQNSGVEAITDDTKVDEPVEYYNLQGMRVNNPTNGIYIRRQGNDVSKIRL